MDLAPSPASSSRVAQIKESPTAVGDDHAAPAGDMPSSAGEGEKRHTHGKDPLARMLEDAEHLLAYAAEEGMDVDPDIAQRIVTATRQGSTAWDSPDAGALVAAIAKLAVRLHPVTASSLRHCREDATKTMHSYTRRVKQLAWVLIPFSVAAFITTRVSNTITADITAANALLVTLHPQADGADPAGTSQAKFKEMLGDLQQFAVEMRAIYSRTRQLNWTNPLYARDVVAEKYPDPEKRYAAMQIPANLSSMTDLVSVVNDLTPVYQKVRFFATEVLDGVSIVWGAINACILPVLYALLGAYAYVVRSFSKAIEARTFTPSCATPARFIIAAIGGGVVGLFNNFTIGPTTSLSPLAVAFLVGYAADLFFNFLEGATPVPAHRR
jgi:hypothetical protein